MPVQSSQSPWRTWASHSTKATGDPLLDSLLARETNQPQNPGCLTANFKTRIICLTHMPVESADLEDSKQTAFCPPPVWCYQDGGCEPKEVGPAEAGQLDEAADMEVGSWGGVRDPRQNPFGYNWNSMASPKHHYLDTSPLDPWTKHHLSPVISYEILMKYSIHFLQRCEGTNCNQKNAQLLLKPGKQTSQWIPQSTLKIRLFFGVILHWMLDSPPFFLLSFCLN